MSLYDEIKNAYIKGGGQAVVELANQKTSSTTSTKTTISSSSSARNIDRLMQDVVSGSVIKTVTETPNITPSTQPTTTHPTGFVGPTIQEAQIPTPNSLNPIETFQQPPKVLYPFRDITFFYKKSLPPTITDVTGNIVPKSELLSYIPYSQGYTDIQKIKYAQQHIMGLPVKNIPPLEAYTNWGVTPSQTKYPIIQSKLLWSYTANEILLGNLLATRQQIQTSEANVQWGLDLNNNGIIETNEIVSKNVAYETVNKDIFNLRVGLTDISYTSKVLKEYESAGYGLEETSTGFKFTTLTAKQTHEKIYGTNLSTSRFVAKQAMNLGLSTLFNVGRWSEYEEEEYSRLLELSKQPNESILSYTGRFWTSPEAFESVWIPALTFGAGYTLSAVSKGALAATKIGTATRIGLKGVLGGTGIVFGTMAGLSVASTALYDSEHLGTVGGHLLGGSILGAGGFVLGSRSYTMDFKPKMKDGKPVYNVRLDVSDTQIKNTLFGRKQGVFGKFKAYAEVIVEGEKPGTSFTTRVPIKRLITLRGSGHGGIPISESLQISESRGWFYDTWGKGGKPTSAFETYGKNTIPVEYGETGLKVSAEKFISGVYGKTPDVYTGGGISFTKPLGSTTIPIEVGTGKLSIKAFGKFDITSRVSIGSFESNLVSGNYFETGISRLLKGFETGKIIVETPQVSSMKLGIQNFISDTSGYLRTISSKPFVESMLRGSIISQSVSQSMSSFGIGKIGIVPITSISTIGLGGATSISSISIPKTVTVTKVEPVTIQKISPISISKTKVLPMIKTKQVIEPITNLEPETITIQKIEPITINKQDTITIPKVETIIIPKTKTIVVPKTETIQMQKQAQVLIQKTEPIVIQKLTPSTVTPIHIIPPIVPKIVIPFIPSGEGFVGKSGKGFYLGYSKGYRYRMWKVPTLSDFVPNVGKYMKWSM